MIILTQRPLITDTYCNPHVAHESITASTSAANQILRIVHDYSSRYAIGSSPYLLSYATYISATVHVLVVAQKGKESSSFQSLIFCISILHEHRHIYAAAVKARENLDKLMAHLGISVDEDVKDGFADDSSAQKGQADVRDQAREQREVHDVATDLGGFPQTSWEFSDLDLDALSQLFFGDCDLQSLMHPLGS